MSDFQAWTMSLMVICLWGLWLMYRLAVYAINRALPAQPEQWKRDQ